MNKMILIGMFLISFLIGCGSSNNNNNYPTPVIPEDNSNEILIDSCDDETIRHETCLTVVENSCPFDTYSNTINALENDCYMIISGIVSTEMIVPLSKDKIINLMYEGVIWECQIVELPIGGQLICDIENDTCFISVKEGCQ